MSDVLIILFVGFTCLGYAWWAAVTVLRHGVKEIDDLSARIDKLETKEIERE